MLPKSYTYAKRGKKNQYSYHCITAYIQFFFSTVLVHGSLKSLHNSSALFLIPNWTNIMLQ